MSGDIDSMASGATGGDDSCTGDFQPLEVHRQFR
jgi:hypothetical protein